MRTGLQLLTLCFALLGATNAQEAPVDECPTKTEYACFDVINSSLCLSSNAAGGDKEKLAKCVDFPGGMSDLSGAQKLCRCPGCHSASINAQIKKLFPAPCA